MLWKQLHSHESDSLIRAYSILLNSGDAAIIVVAAGKNRDLMLAS